MLKIHLLGAKNLPVMDFRGSSDPYCIFTVGQQVIKSHVVEKSISPFWNEDLMICVVDDTASNSSNSSNPAPSTSMNVKIYDWDRAKKHDFISEFSMSLADVLKNPNETKNFNLELEFAKPSAKKVGRIYFDLCYIPIDH